MRRPPVGVALLLTLLLVPSSVVLRAATSVVQTTTCFGNDAVCTFSAAPSASNVVLILSLTRDTINTIDITGFHSDTETVLVNAVQAPTFNGRAFAFCATGDGADTTLVVTTNGSGSAFSALMEVSGAENCAIALDDSLTAENINTTAHDFNDDPLSTSVAGAFMAAMVVTDDAGADFTSNSGGGWTSLPAGDAEINSRAQAQYRVAGAAGPYATSFTTPGNENTYLVAVALKAAASGAVPCLLSLMGVGRC